jgi:DNA replication protein DnaC
MKNNPDKFFEELEKELLYLKLTFMNNHYKQLADDAAAKQHSHMEYFHNLVLGEAEERKNRARKRRIQLARFPVIKTLEQFRWNWPKKINQLHVQNLFRLSFIKDKGNVIFLGGVGLGKTHLATALGHTACLRGYTVLFTTAIDVINSLSAAKNAGQLQMELKKYLRPSLLILDELGYLPIDKVGADLLFRAFKQWPKIFNNDSTLTSAILDRLLHHAETVLVEGKSYRMKDQIET